MTEHSPSTDPAELTFDTRCGTVALLGRPNVGKSSILNAILGMKIAATSHKPQTTQRQLRAVETRGNGQIVFVDTPGIHKPKKGMHDYMVGQALDAARDVDVLVVVVEALREKEMRGDLVVDARDIEIVQKLRQTARARDVVLVINKIDRLDDKTALLPALTAWSETEEGQNPFAAIVPVSAERKNGLDELVDTLMERLPEGPFIFPADALTDASEKDLVAELIREKAMLELAKELPYRIAVVVEEFDETRRDDPRKPLVSIHATLNVERESQKGIVVGKRGARIRAIGSRARKDVERLLDCQVMLKLFVRVEKDWTTNPKAMRKLGYR